MDGYKKRAAYCNPFKQNKLKKLFAHFIANINVFNDFVYYYYVVCLYTFAYYCIFIIYAGCKKYE